MSIKLINWSTLEIEFRLKIWVSPAVEESGFSSGKEKYSWFWYLDTTQSTEKDKYS